MNNSIIIYVHASIRPALLAKYFPLKDQANEAIYNPSARKDLGSSSFLFQEMSRATTAAETFSSLKKTIQSKFVSQDNILLNDSSVVEPDLNAKPIEKFDDRPLYIRLAETRNKEEEEFDAQFMLSKS